ncbi:uncharacterized protein LOC127812070 [Diospyros lotus]|uniref:uncharacterized protein LOC127812070 n=1 Tax=Diospyros lotus TaxID=55363 RepID=UPI00225577AA|nr:uncharacterized protein LOC127812070 [Diospyros lotus]
MATSFLMASEKKVGGMEEPPPRPDNGKPSGRRRLKSGEAAQKIKKQPQRGMGVAELERRRRLQENLNGMTDNFNPVFHSLNHHFLPTAPLLDETPASYASPIAKFGGYGGAGQLGHLNPRFLLPKFGHGGGSGVEGVFSDQFQAGALGFGAPNLSLLEASKELSSIPNMSSYESDNHYGLCHKKKRVNGDQNLGCNGMRDKFGDSFLGLNLGNKQTMAGGAPSYNADQEVEVVAVHRKLGRSMVMEYEFFPGGGVGGGRGGTESKEWELGGSEASVAVGSEASASSSSAATTCLQASTTTTTTSIDLSLKLSY